jgi:hypothetical protein
MKDFNIIWKFAVIGFLLAITVSLGMIKFKIDDVESLLTVPEMELPEHENAKSCCLEDGQ